MKEVSRDDIRNSMESTLVFDEFTLEDYLTGRCQIFAYVLNQLFDFSMFCIWDTNVESEELVLVHAYCKDDTGYWVDARGVLDSEKTLLEPFDYAFPYHSLYTAEEFEILMLTGMLERPLKGEIKAIKHYITSHMKTFLK